MLTDTDAVVRRRQEEARRSAESIIAAAEAEAEQLRESARVEAQSERASAQRTVEKLTQQRNSVAAYLEELRGLLTTETASALEGITPMQERPLALDEGEASAADLPSASQD